MRGQEVEEKKLRRKQSDIIPVAGTYHLCEIIMEVRTMLLIPPRILPSFYESTAYHKAIGIGVKPLHNVWL